MAFLAYFLKIFQTISSLLFFLIDRFQFALVSSLPYSQFLFLDLRFLDFGFEEDEEDELHFQGLSLSARLACQKINSLELPAGTEGDALRAHFLLRERALSKCPLYTHLNDLTLMVLDSGLGGGLEWLNKTHPECASGGIGIKLESMHHLAIISPNITIMEERIEAAGSHEMETEKLLKCLPSSSVDIFLHISDDRWKAKEEEEEKEEGEGDYFKQIYRLLSPGGFLCRAGIRSREGRTQVFGATDGEEEIGLRLICEEEDVSQQVCRGMLLTWPRFDSMLNQLPFWLRPYRNAIGNHLFPDYAAFDMLKNGKRVFLLSCWKKTE